MPTAEQIRSVSAANSLNFKVAIPKTCQRSQWSFQSLAASIPSSFILRQAGESSGRWLSVLQCNKYGIQPWRVPYLLARTLWWHSDSREPVQLGFIFLGTYSSGVVGFISHLGL